jgi:hypothetical protein
MSKNRNLEKEKDVPQTPTFTIESLKERFHEADVDKTGSLDKRKMLILLTNLGIIIPDEEVDKMIKSVAKGNREELDFEDFLHLFDMTRVKALFKEIDTSKVHYKFSDPERQRWVSFFSRSKACITQSRVASNGQTN